MDEGRLSVPQRAWNAKRERQYEHIKSGLKRRGDSESLAEEIAARTVNKERARSGEANQTVEENGQLLVRFQYFRQLVADKEVIG